MKNIRSESFLNLLLISLLFITACSSEKRGSEENTPFVFHDPLPSWNDGKNKQEVIQFVLNSTHQDSANYIPEEARIAVFDNDGTLWSEQPAYFQLFFAVYQIKKMAPDHPEWKEEEPYKSILEEGMTALAHMEMKDIVEIVMQTHAGMTTEDFSANVEEWVKTDRHPRFERRFDELVYQPMLELINFLKAYQFKVFIVSGGGQDFMRPWATEVYGIPSENIIGSNIKAVYDYNDGAPIIRRLPEINFVDDKEGKPVGIQRHIGIKPTVCVGNSDGDLQMMEWTDSNTYPSLKIFVHHTDSVREWAYDRDSHIGKFDKTLDRSKEKGWNIVDMSQDWKVIYPFEIER